MNAETNLPGSNCDDVHAKLIAEMQSISLGGDAIYRSAAKKILERVVNNPPATALSLLNDDDLSGRRPAGASALYDHATTTLKSIMAGQLRELESFLRTTRADQGGEATFGNWVRATAADAQEFGHSEAVEYLRLGGDLGEQDLGADEQRILQDSSRGIRLQVHGIVITVSPQGAGAIQSSLHDAGESPEAKAALDAVESMILAHAVAGINVDSPAYLEGIETAVEAISNQYGDEPESKCRAQSPGM